MDSAKLPLDYPLSEALTIYSRRVTVFFTVTALSFLLLVALTLAMKLIIEPRGDAILRAALVTVLGCFSGLLVLVAARWATNGKQRHVPERSLLPTTMVITLPQQQKVHNGVVESVHNNSVHVFVFTANRVEAESLGVESASEEHEPRLVAVQEQDIVRSTSYYSDHDGLRLVEL